MTYGTIRRCSVTRRIALIAVIAVVSLVVLSRDAQAQQRTTDPAHHDVKTLSPEARAAVAAIMALRHKMVAVDRSQAALGDEVSRTEGLLQLLVFDSSDARRVDQLRAHTARLNTLRQQYRTRGPVDDEQSQHAVASVRAALTKLSAKLEAVVAAPTSEARRLRARTLLREIRAANPQAQWMREHEDDPTMRAVVIEPTPIPPEAQMPSPNGRVHGRPASAVAK